MKRLWFAVIFLGISISLCVFEQITISKTFTTFDKDISTIEQSVKDENYEDVIATCDELEKEWEKKYPTFSSMIEHSCLDELETSIYSIRELAKEENKDELLTAIFTSKSMLSSIKRNQTPSFGTVF